METQLLEKQTQLELAQKLPKIRGQHTHTTFTRKGVIKGLTPRVVQNATLVRYLELQYKLTKLSHLYPGESGSELNTQEKLALLIPQTTIPHKRRVPSFNVQKNFKVRQLNTQSSESRSVSPLKTKDKIKEMPLSTRTVSATMSHSRAPVAQVQVERESPEIDLKLVLPRKVVPRQQLSPQQFSINGVKAEPPPKRVESLNHSTEISEIPQEVYETMLVKPVIRQRTLSKRRKIKLRPSLMQLEKQEKIEEEIQQKLKAIIPKELGIIIRRSNAFDVRVPEPPVSYRFFIPKGNNGTLVKNVLKSRGFWTKAEKKEQANFIWTEWRDKKLMEGMTSWTAEHFEDNEPQSHAIYQKTKPVITKRRLERELGKYGIRNITDSEDYHALEMLTPIQSNEVVMYSKLEFNSQVANKKSLFANMCRYYDSIGKKVFNYLPTTYHVANGEKDPQYQAFAEEFKSEGGMWIIKPGENSNRGCGIDVFENLSQIQAKMYEFQAKERTTIIQRYITNPLLIHKRKFDIRTFAMVTSINGHLQAYFYQEGYLRTSCKKFNLKDLDNKFIHLTNDAIQQKAPDYGKHENGNKLSYGDFTRYLERKYSIDFYTVIYPQIKALVIDTIRAVAGKIDYKKRMQCFEIFGYDFMVDRDYKVWLIEVNTNPCLDTSNVHLARIIPAMLDNAFKLVIDPIFIHPKRHFDGLHENRFDLVFSDYGMTSTETGVVSDEEDEPETDETIV